MPYFLISCKYNPSIKWIIITNDNKNNLDIPPNVEFIYHSFISYCQLVSSKLKINFHPKNPYKLCDIKPALGVIHKDLIKNYDFWGFGDLDVIYGDLRKYFSEDRLNKKSLFSTHKTRVAGHLCLIKNHPKLNQAFMKVRNWRNIFEDEKHYAFDEKNFSKIFLKHKNLPKFLRNILKLFNPWLRLAEFNEVYSTANTRIKWLDDTLNFPETWFWNKGKITNNLNEEIDFPYFHFMVWKKNWIDDDSKVPKRISPNFCINSKGFYQKQNSLRIS